MYDKVLVVLPKVEAYRFKEEATKANIRSIVLNWINTLSAIGVKYIMCFAEDELAIELLGDRADVRFVSVLGAADSNYIKGIYPHEQYSKYVSLISKSIEPVIIKEAVGKFKAPAIVAGKDIEQYNTERCNILNKRIRHACNRYMDNNKFVLYFDDGLKSNVNSFCTEPVPAIGDGRIIAIVDFMYNTNFISLGGQPLEFNVIKELVRSVNQND